MKKTILYYGVSIFCLFLASNNATAETLEDIANGYDRFADPSSWIPPFGTDVQLADEDGDGIPDGRDFCDLSSTKKCDSKTLSSCFTSSSDDICALVTTKQNCTEDWDMDGDGLGDRCDEDIDGDGVNNGVDVNPFSTDADKDGTSDKDDECPLVYGIIKKGGTGECSVTITNTVTKVTIVDSDTDNDGIVDAAEGTISNPNDPDSDDDKVCDGPVAVNDSNGVGICTAGPDCAPMNPALSIDCIISLDKIAVKDADGDGLADDVEKYVTLTDTTKKDSDGDGISDGDEVLKKGSDPLDLDTDNDGICDGIPTITVPVVEKSKKDPKTGKVTKVKEAECTVNLSGKEDNCILVVNVDQKPDANDANVGAACYQDDDGDTIKNFQADGKTLLDNCRWVHNTDQADADKDGTGDACDGDFQGLAPAPPKGGGPGCSLAGVAGGNGAYIPYFPHVEVMISAPV